jgi:alpha-ketoglutarate-dependent taurine dioxygenase
MEESFSTIIGLLPIAAIIAIRLFASMKKGQQSRPVPRREEVFEENDEEESFRPHWEVDVASRAQPRPGQAGYSSRDRPDRNRGAAPALKAAARTKFQETIRAYEKKAKEERAALSGTAPRAAQQAAPVPKASAPPRPNETKAKGSAFAENLACYTPLQRAVIMAEILGPPKGFD